MPWTKNDYPPSMKNLEERVRRKAVKIANALLEEGYEEGRAIAIATAKAEEWNENHPEPSGDEGQEKPARNRSSKRQHAGEREKAKKKPLHVVPHDGGWAVKQEGAEEPGYKAETKEKATRRAKEWASKDETSAIIHRKDGTIEKSHRYS